tara:strand:+ start:3103 stop:3351 length:249 start_codon:yes stop_codon:yes gene_type:complete
MANTTGKKHGGREKETPNVLTKEEREVLKVVVFEEVALIQNHLKGLDPKVRLQILIKLLPYVCPKLDNIQYELGEPMEWSIS